MDRSPGNFRSRPRSPPLNFPESNLGIHHDLLGGDSLVFLIQNKNPQRSRRMNIGGANKKRLREEQESSPPEDSCGHKQALLEEFEAGMAFDKDENAGNENFPEFCSLSNQYSTLLKDSWNWEYSTGFGIESTAAIRKQSYILDYLHDSSVDISSEEEVAEQQKLQVEEEDCLRGSLFEATDDQLWMPQSPLPNTEALFSLDSMGSHDCTTMLQDENFSQGAASCARIWEQDDDHKDKKKHADGMGLVSDWIWGVSLDQSQFSESVEFESSLQSL